ncbi:hypothetical protein JCM6882_001803 [Rhodosporidiobolus microsporus]
MNLLDLPPELVAQIFAFVGPDDLAAKRPICRALLPLTRRALFRKVSLRTTSRLGRFHRLLHPTNARQSRGLRRTVKDDRPLGLNVREMHLPMVDYDSDDENDHDDLKDCKSVRRILASTFEVEMLTLEGSALLKLALPSKRSAFRFPNLRTLRVLDLDSNHSLLYDMNRFGRLRFWHALRTVEVALDPDLEDADDVAPPRRARALTHIKHLSLTAGVSLSTASAANFVSHFTALRSLTLTLVDLTELSLALEAAPTTLTSLTIVFDIGVDWELGEDGIVLDPLIARFVNLTSLHLGERTFSSALFRVLSESLPRLSTLHLECGEHVDLAASSLLEYLRAGGLSHLQTRGRSRGPLTQLTLDAFLTCIDLIPSEHPDRANVADGTFRIDAWWILPNWTISFSLEDAREVVRVAGETGVRLEGTLLEAIEAEELKVREEKYLQDRADDILLSLADLFSQC